MNDNIKTPYNYNEPEVARDGTYGLDVESKSVSKSVSKSHYSDELQSALSSERPTEQFVSEIQGVEAPGKSNGKIREFSVREVNRGFIVTVGCHTFALETRKSLVEKLSAYILEPDKVESNWFAGNLFND